MSTGPSVRPFLRFLTGRRTLILAPLSRGVMVVLVNVIKPQGLEPLQFPTKFRSPSLHPLGAAGVLVLVLRPRLATTTILALVALLTANVVADLLRG